MALVHLKDLPSDGQTGKWGLSCTDKVIEFYYPVHIIVHQTLQGYVMQETFILILDDLDKFLTLHSIQCPVILWLDGASPHLSLAMAEFCRSKRIQPLLLKPNSTHICQPLDQTWFRSLKARLQRKIQQWHQCLEHIGSSLSKYSVVPLLREATEELLEEKPSIMSNGFKQSGLCPWNPAALDSAKMQPSTVFVR